MGPIAAGHAPQELADFAGSWQLERTISDRAGGPDGRFEGTARLSHGRNGLIYEEAGELSLAGQQPVNATRRYLWCEAVPGRIAVSFEDGRPFHEFLLAGAAEANHFCPPDHYRVRYDFLAWPVWSARWQVTGPRKDYLLVSQFAPRA